MGENPLGGLSPIFLEEDIPDVMTCFKFGDDRLTGLASVEGQISPFLKDFDGRPYNTQTLPCERVIISSSGISGCSRHTDGRTDC